MLEEGKKAPPFSLASSEGGEVSLADFSGRWLVLYFYPKDETGGCTREAHEFRDASKELKKRRASVVGVSRDSIASHCRFRDKHALDFPLASDPDAKTIAKYGAWGEKNNYGKKYMGIIRSTVIVSPDGVVAHVFPKVKADGHAAQVLAVLDDLAGGARSAKPTKSRKAPALTRKATRK